MIIAENAENGNVHSTADINSTTIVESTDQLDASNSSLKELTPAQRIKATTSFRLLMESDGQKLKKSGKRWKCLCPFHADRTPSFFINEDDDYARCFGCSWHGNVFEYVMARTECSFGAAFHLLKDHPTLHGTRTLKSASKKIKESDYKLTATDLQSIEKYTSRVCAEAWLAERIATERGWKTSTIQSLAGSNHLGWAGDALAFIFETGVKIRRWPGRDFRWDIGEPDLWRADLLNSADEVYLTEGETDAISLIDAGIEKVQGTVVVALPSATTYRDAWTKLFTDKVVTICQDADPAGDSATMKAIKALSPVARQVFTFNPKEVR